MKECVLIACRPPAGDCSGHASGTIVYWDSWDTPNGISLPARLAADFERIRAEHAAWAYETGKARVGGKTLSGHLAAGAPLSLWWCSLLYERHPKMTPGLYTLYRLRALELLLESEKATDVRLIGGEPILQQSLRALCAASNRRLRVEACPKSKQKGRQGGLTSRLYRICPAPARALVRYAHWWWTVRRRLPFAGDAALPDTQQTGATIVTYFPNIDMQSAQQGCFRSRYFETLHDALRPQAESLRWLFIRFPAPDISLDQCLALRSRFAEESQDGVSFHYLEEFLSFRGMLSAFTRWARLVFASLRLTRPVKNLFHLAGSRINFWHILGTYWAESFRGWRCLERCLHYQAFLTWTRLAGPQRWTLFPLENCPWERMVTHAVHSAGNGPVYGAQHSTLRPADLRYFDDPRTFTDPECALFQPDSLRANGQNALVQWRKCGVPENRLGTVEALRYLYLLDIKEKRTAKSQLVVVTSFFADETHDHLALLAKALRAGLLDSFDIVIKPHPCLPTGERLRSLLGNDAKRLREVRGPIAEHLGGIMWASNSTTAALEAAASGIPVMVMQPPEGEFDLCPLQGLPNLARTANLEDVRHGLSVRAPFALPSGYFALDRELPRWRNFLNL